MLSVILMFSGVDLGAVPTIIEDTPYKVVIIDAVLPKSIYLDIIDTV